MKKIIQISLLQILFMISFTKANFAYTCGQEFKVYSGEDATSMCQCEATNNDPVFMGAVPGSPPLFCCGFYEDKKCRTYEDENTYGCGEKNNSATVPDGAICSCAGGQWESYWQSKVFGDRGVCCGWVNDKKTQCLAALPGANDVYCGEVYDPNSEKQCVCGGGSGRIPITDGENKGKTCCGWFRDGECKSTDSVINDVEVTDETLNNLNPLLIGGGDPTLSTPGGIISKALKSFIFPIAGAILFVILILGGFQMLAGANNSKSLEEGKQRITSAIIGFILLFAAYWITQLLELIFGIRILS